MRSRAPPVADAARRSTRSGRKNRASEQREDFFGHRKADGADAPAAPYKHRLAYAPGNRPLVFRAGVPVRRGLGVYPKSLLNWGPHKVVRPCGERRAHRSGEGCPNQGVGSTRLKRRLRPTRRSKSATPAVAVQIMPLQKPAPTILNHKNPARCFLAPGGKLDACFIVLGCSLSSTVSRCPTPAHKYPPCAGCSGHFPGRSHRTDPHPPPPRRR